MEKFAGGPFADFQHFLVILWREKPLFTLRQDQNQRIAPSELPGAHCGGQRRGGGRACGGLPDAAGHHRPGHGDEAQLQEGWHERRSAAADLEPRGVFPLPPVSDGAARLSRQVAGGPQPAQGSTLVDRRHTPAPPPARFPARAFLRAAALRAGHRHRRPLAAEALRQRLRRENQQDAAALQLGGAVAHAGSEALRRHRCMGLHQTV